MAQLADETVEEIVHEGESMALRDLFDNIERAHLDRAGVDRELLAAYARTLADRRDYSFDAEGFLESVEKRTTDDETWTGAGQFDELDGDRLSQYLQRFHDRLGGSDDVAASLAFLDEG